MRAVPGRRVRAAELTGSTAAARDAVHYLLTSPSLGGRLGPMLVCDGVDWPAVLAEAEAMSGGQRLLLYAAYDLWAAEGVVVCDPTTQHVCSGSCVRNMATATCGTFLSTKLDHELNDKYGKPNPATFDRRPAPAPGAVSYEREIRPLFERRCVVCHG